MEKHSRKAFEESASKAQAIKEGAIQLQNAGELPPELQKTLHAKFMVEDMKQKQMIGSAHEEAIQMDKERTKEKYPLMSEFKKVIFTTESGNKYIMERSADGSHYVVVNTKEGTITHIPTVSMDVELRIGRSFIVPGILSTTNVKEGQGLR